MKTHASPFFDFKMRMIAVTFIGLLILFGIFHVSEILDARFYYDETEALEFFQTLSAKDRALYQKFAVVDLFFILNYVSFLFLVLQRMFSSLPKAKYLAFLPGIFDLFETSFILNFLISEKSFGQFSWLGWMTTLKWVSLLAVILLLAIQALRRKT